MLVAATKQLEVAQIDCAEVMLAYTEGMMCFACEAGYDSFIDEESKVWLPSLTGYDLLWFRQSVLFLHVCTHLYLHTCACAGCDSVPVYM
jgi:hypothetical protein